MNLRRLWQQRPNLARMILFAVFIGSVPLWARSSQMLSTAIFIGIYTIVTLGLCLLVGYAGQISLGHAAFMGMGAYTSAILSAKLDVSPWLGMVAGVLVTAALAYLIGQLIFNFREHYLALATLGLGIIVFLVFGEMRGLTGGASGLRGVPRLAVGNFVFDADIKYYYLVWAFVLVFIGVALNVVNSRIGRALRAIRSSELAANSIGIDSSRYKLQILVLSVIFASVAGSLYVHYMRFVSPDPFNFGASVRLIVMAAVGGLASVWGAPFGVAAVLLLTELLRKALPLVIPNASGEHTVIAYGIILILIMVFMPEGLTSGLVRAVRWRSSKLRT
jgi:branched-chain amino acid transport system permease protein